MGRCIPIINPAHYESEDGVFNLPLFLYDSLRDTMKAEFDQVRSVIDDDKSADRVVRLIKNRYQTLWSQLSLSLFKVGLVEPCTCRPKEVCSKCQGAQWIMVKGIDYKALSKHSDMILRDALTRRMQSDDHKQLVREHCTPEFVKTFVDKTTTDMDTGEPLFEEESNE